MRLQDLDGLEAHTRTLLAGAALTEPTRRVLQARLDRTFGPPQALASAEFATLRATCLRLIPEPELVERVALAAALEARWAAGEPRGWRYAESPADLDLFRSGLQALDAAASGRFAALDAGGQDRLLAAAAAGEAPFDAAHRLQHWFEELLSAAVEVYYAHPLVQVSIGYDGMADAGPLAVGSSAVAQEADRLDR